jgi:hypothetical protein
MYIAGRIGGARPQPALFNLVIVWIIFGATPLAVGVLVLQSSPQRTRVWLRTLVGVFLLFLVVGADGNLGPTNWHGAFRREKRPGTDAASLKRTVVTPVLAADMAEGTNLLWCCTFQLAWNEARRITGGDIQLEKRQRVIEERMSPALNKESFTKESLDESSFVAMAGLVKDNIHEKIRSAIEEKFRGEFKPRFIPDKSLTPNPDDLVVYACLYKNLSFPVPFERLDELLTFGGTRVPAFGMGPHREAIERMYPQVLILDYRNEDDFVIELKTESDGDRLILAKLQPQSTFSETLSTASARVSNRRPESATTNDLLLVPRMKFDITREFKEIERLHLIPKSTNIASNLNLVSAVQNTAFELNEKGVELRSESHVAFACAAQRDPAPKHRLIFDKPFLVLMQRSDAKMPYFALWVDNPEVLVSWR